MAKRMKCPRGCVPVSGLGAYGPGLDQHKAQRQAQQRIADRNSAFLDIQRGPNPLTPEEVDRLIERHPGRYEIFRAWGAKARRGLGGLGAAGRMRCPPEGTKVVFAANPASRMMYSSSYELPDVGATGTVVTVPLPGGRKTCMPGPGGGFVYVKWENGRTFGVAPRDLAKAKRTAVQRSQDDLIAGRMAWLDKETRRKRGLDGCVCPPGLGVASDTYVSTYCNRPHRKSDGKPVRHECRIIPPAALKAEMEGDYERAIQIMESTPRRTMRRGVAGLDDGEPSEPDEDDIITEDHTHWYQSGKLYFTGDEAGLRRKMDKDRFWPNTWFRSDHGNMHLIEGGGTVPPVHSDEPDEPDGGDDGPDGDDISTEDHRRWYQSGELYFTGDEAGLRQKMDADRFWPNVWFISDHGNAHLIEV